MTIKSRPEYRTIAQAVQERPWLTERYLRRLVFERRVPFSKVGGRVVVDLLELDLLVSSSRIEARGEFRSQG